MQRANRSAAQLREQITKTEHELKSLKAQLAHVEASAASEDTIPWKWPLSQEEYERYSRQLILPSVGVQGQVHIRDARVLVIGAGGLGCPAAAYLAGAGVGTLGIVDGDTVEASNLHRQIGHSTAYVGQPKAESLVAYCQKLNPLPRYIPYATHLTPTTAEQVVSQYDLVLDCTDHPTSRYLISDICVLLRKPLVSASALRTDGQLIVLNSPPAPQGSLAGGPCYRCVFPRPSPPESVTSCGEGGILGPVVGALGVLQALEAIRLIASGRHQVGAEMLVPDAKGFEPERPTLLLFSAAGTSPLSFRSVRMRGRRKDCFACSSQSALTRATLASGSLDYVAFCGGVIEPLNLLNQEERVSAREYQRLATQQTHVLLDVREPEHFGLASLEGAINVPFSRIQAEEVQVGDDKTGTQISWLPPNLSDQDSIYVVCSRGNDSQVVVQRLKELGVDQGGRRFVGEIAGGLVAWKKEVDSTLPFT